MILLFGGTSETAPIALGLAEAGYSVLVSTATDAALNIGEHPRISRRMGRLTTGGMLEIVSERGVRAIVDATHPYASAARTAARQAAKEAGIPYFTFIRPGLVEGDAEAVFAADHEEAARLAFSFGSPVLLTTGSRNLEPYVLESRRRGIDLVARVLDHPESVEACRSAGLDENHVITGRGPFPVEDNIAAIRRFGIGVMVTKDSGEAGGMDAKLGAAHSEGCKMVVIRRPEQEGCSTVEELIGRVVGAVSRA